MALSNKQRAFVEAYLANGFNATRAAITAGYSEKTARSQGARLLTNVDIKAATEARLRQFAMSADEALARLSDQARGSMSDFVDPVTLDINLVKAETAAKLHLIKKFTHTIGKETENFSIELYDAQTAQLAILKEQRLTEGKPTEIVDDASLTDEDRASRITALLDRARARRDGRAGAADARTEFADDG